MGAGLSFAAIDNLTLVASRLPVDQRDGAAGLIDAFTSSGIFDVSAFAFAVCAASVLRTPNDEWDLPAR